MCQEGRDKTYSKYFKCQRDKNGKAVRGVVDEDLMGQLKTFTSLPLERGESGRCAIRVIDDAGSISEAILELPD